MKFIPETVSRKVATQAFRVNQASPTLLFGAGIVGMVGTVVLASRATLRLEDVLEETNEKLADVRTLTHSESAKYDKKDADHDKAILYVDAVVKITKLYAPAVGLGIVSVACLTSSHRILTKRNAALTAAYATLEKGFKEYRARVVADLGEEKDREYLYGTQKVEVVDENGKKSKKTVLGDGKYSMYARIYDETNPHWQGIPELDRIFLEGQQRYANDRLRAKGHLILNDVYRALGMEDTPDGCVVGWLWDGDGDNYVDFGFGDWPNTHDYIHAREVGVVLDFNVDGLVYKKI